MLAPPSDSPAQEMAAAPDLCALLEARLDARWAEHLEASTFAARCLAGNFDSRFYAMYLTETFHYTRHNARNQALVGVRAEASPEYLRYCFRHALEETGHELMALHDLEKLGLSVPGAPLPEPLPETQVLVAYLYWISGSGDPMARLGYSFWAEDAYRHLAPLLTAATQRLGLTAATSTFLSAHAAIDARHAEEVRELVRKEDPGSLRARRITEAMETSLALTFRILDALDREFALLQKGHPTRHLFAIHAAH